MIYNTEEILKNITSDKNDDYKVYWETERGDFITEDYLTGPEAIVMFTRLKMQCKVKYVELQYDPQEDEELEDRIILDSVEKREIDLFGHKIYLE